MQRIALALTLAVLTLLRGPDMALANGPVVVTVTGQIATTNRGAFDPFNDSLFGALDEKFERAFAFTLQDLAALPQKTVEVGYPNWPGPVTVSGPTLAAVLQAVGAEGSEVLVQAIDGYAPSFKISEVEAGTFVLATSMAGVPLSIGGRGPTWLVFPAGSYEGQTAEDDSGLAWAVFHLKVTSGE
ncbi:MAG: hypothetical protein P1U88_16540 [Thalassobaculaceae bacterium]|nr:hypothetical protein [Thalassobaculaceae bacterium]